MLNAAWQIRIEAIIRAFEPRAKADLVVLDRDLYSSDPFAIQTIEVDLTVWSRRLVYKKLNSENPYYLGALGYER